MKVDYEGYHADSYGGHNTDNKVNLFISAKAK